MTQTTHARKINPKIFATAQNIKEFGNETRHIEFHFAPGTRFEFTAGQFITVFYPHDGRVTKRPYSIASAPSSGDHIDLCIKLVEGGAVTHWLWHMKGGEEIQIQGPYGKFILPEEIDFEPVFVATGTGIAPFRSMIHTLLENGFRKDFSLLFGVRFDNAIPYENEWRALEKRYPNFKYIPTVSRSTPEWKGEKGYAQALIGKYFREPKRRRVYICGLNDMIQAVKQVCLDLGYAADQIFHERYD
ncbi:MAG: FAD-dependent oxidoreductase [Candidatus Omnitrophica bacterium]|nr:FAD-dependent oxidoreductase [Candidatus Omnitrophota bacterium]